MYSRINDKWEIRITYVSNIRVLEEKEICGIFADDTTKKQQCSADVLANKLEQNKIIIHKGVPSKLYGIRKPSNNIVFTTCSQLY